MTLRLTGYFDNNFGDDLMMKIIVRSLPEIEFVIDKRENVSPMILSEKNVRLSDDFNKYPVLNVTGSGFMINSKRALFTELVWFLKRKKSGDYCLGCNIEPLGNGLKKFLISSKLNKYKLIVCRDKKSREWLNSNIKTHIEYLPDILFYMPDEWIPEASKRDKLGIAVMNMGYGEDAQRYYRAMAEIADFYAEKNQSQVYLLAFNTGIENDMKACEIVKRLTKNQSDVRIISHGKNMEILKAYSECEKIIATRFHAAVLALRTEVDMFPIIYRKKMENLLDDIEYSNRGCNITSIDISKIKKFIEEKSNFKMNSNFLKREITHAQIMRNELERTI